jgi:hypothetical protein
MDAKEKNKIKCREYYLKTKDNLSEEVKEKRREQAKVRQKIFYERNKELCKLRVYKTRIKNLENKEVIKKKLQKYECLITESEIKFIKELNLTLAIRKAPRLTMWNKKISKWNFKDFKKLQSLLT